MSESSPMAGTAGEALVDLARRYGTPVVFGVVSIHNQPLVDAVAHRLRFVPVRHEAAAVNAADAYSRAAGSLGIALTSTGTGAGNAAGSLIESLTAGSAVLHVTGQIDSQFVGQGRGVIHETKDQHSMLAAVSKHSESVGAGESVGQALARAAAAASAPPCGPASIEIPIDLQYEPTEFVALAAGDPPVADPADVTRAARMISGSRRPLLWLGGGAVGARAQVERLVEATGAGVLTSNAGRGTLDETHPAVVGNFAAAEGATDLLASSDLLVSIGTHFRSNETRHYKLSLPTPHIQVDIDRAAIDRSYPTDIGLHGDSAATLRALIAEARPNPDPSWPTAVAHTRMRVRAELRTDIGPYGTICDAMRAAMQLSSPFVRDVTIPASAWGNRLLDVHHPSTNINPRGGGIGQGLAMALGASLAQPDVPTMTMIGDGGLAVHMGELATIAQEQPWIVMVLFNDGGYGVLRNLQDHHFGRRAGVDLTNPRFETLADAFGLDHVRLTDIGHAFQTLQDAVGLRRPVLVEVDCEAIGPMPRPFVPPVPVQNERQR